MSTSEDLLLLVKYMITIYASWFSVFSTPVFIYFFSIRFSFVIFFSDLFYHFLLFIFSFFCLMSVCFLSTLLKLYNLNSMRFFGNFN